ncbi:MULTISPECIES: type II toxin-antitoxin system VapB family antitoxin [unclassified Streptomyces]|uniref:type II toxin-antitoxin system VapB family antitoxin n=1 Tax=unclassified Streptomyces TaxID=2593676 RepID=UPI0006F53BAA|nr:MULTISPECIES: type II toxin-antitoxin system VapB family antitoxin [unclassified Streptomyces]KQX52838.1 antitoxin VapB6 [Streptomyces sp. Root1304]KRA89753.1 antitoxin VapB6 [Streptomyces sp. Root66D1]
MGVTNVDVDDDVLAEAAKLLGTTTKKDTINTALEEVIRRHRRRAAFQRLAERGARGDLERTRRDWEARKAAQHGGDGE